MRALLLFLSFALFVSGCASNSITVPTTAQMLDYNQSVLERYQIEDQWWTVYNDPQLNYLLETALVNNIDLAIAAIDINKALYQANVLGADLVPEFSGGLDASISRSIKSGNNTIQDFSGKLGVSYEVDLWRRLADTVSAQEWELKATIEDRETARLALINSVVDAYYNLAYLDNAIAVTRASIDHYRQIKELTTIKYDNGKVDMVEPAQATQSMLSTENNLLGLQNQYKNAQMVMRNLLNFRPEDELDIIAPNLKEMVLPPVDLNVPLSVLANRPDLRASEYRLHSALDSLKATEKSLFPSITIGATFSSASEKARTAFDLPFTGGSISINLPFLQWNRIKWEIKISQAEYESLLLEFEQNINTALNELDYYYYNYLNTRATLAKTEEKHLYDLQISAYYKIRYDVGANELSDWLDALNTAISSEINALNYRYQLIQQENMIYKAMAGRYAATASATP